MNGLSLYEENRALPIQVSRDFPAYHRPRRLHLDRSEHIHETVEHIVDLAHSDQTSPEYRAILLHILPQQACPGNSHQHRQQMRIHRNWTSITFVHAANRVGTAVVKSSYWDMRWLHQSTDTRLHT